MSDLSHRLQQEYEKLKQRRDELRVQLDLGKKEAEDAWLALDEKWGDFENKVKQIGQLSKQTADEVGEAAELLLDELRQGFDRLRNMI